MIDQPPERRQRPAAVTLRPADPEQPHLGSERIDQVLNDDRDEFGGAQAGVVSERQQRAIVELGQAAVARLDQAADIEAARLVTDGGARRALAEGSRQNLRSAELSSDRCKPELDHRRVRRIVEFRERLEFGD